MSGVKRWFSRSVQRLCWVGIGLLIASPGVAQIDNGHLPTDPIRLGILIEPHQPETPYQAHARLIQEELIIVGKALNQLATIDPTTYSRLQDALLTYLRQLKATQPDYGEAAVYESTMLFLQRLQEQTKRGLVEGRRGNVPSPRPAPWAGYGYVVQAHAPLFRRPSFHSRRLRLLESGDWVKVVRTEAGYCYVQTASGNGYLPQRMVRPAAPVSLSTAP